MTLLSFVPLLLLFLPRFLEGSTSDCDRYLFHFQNVVNTEANKNVWRLLEFAVPVQNPFPELIIFSFCEKHNILLLDICGSLLRKLQGDYGYRECKAQFHQKTLTLRDLAMQQAIQQLQTTPNSQDIPQNPLFRIPDYILDFAYKKKPSSTSSISAAKKFCFVHTSSLRHGDDSHTALFYLIMDRFLSARLIDQFELVFIFNSGDEVQQNLKDEILSHTNNVILVELGRDQMQFYEAPTLAALHTFATLLTNTSEQPDHQILFLHTLDVLPSVRGGEGGNDEYAGLINKLLEKQGAVHHLLASGYFDVVGAGFQSFPNRVFGNSWWASTRYISVLPSPLNMGRAEIDSWVLGAPDARLHLLQLPAPLKVLRDGQEEVSVSDSELFDTEFSCAAMFLR